MTSNPCCLPSTADAFEAAMLMANITSHLCVVDEEQRLIGVVSERDLFSFNG